MQIVVSVFVVIHYFNTDRIDGTKGGGITGVLVFLKQCSWVIRKLLKVSVQGKERGTQDGTLQDCGDIDPMCSATGARSIVC